MYLDYNEETNSFKWEELRHLAMAMGFPKDLFDKNIPTEYKEKGTGISIRNLLKCFDDCCFHLDLHFTVNLKSASYNISNFKKAIILVSRRFLSFKQLREVRLAFESYEAYDQKGMRINERIFLRTLKMCGRVISPKKLMHKVKHLKSSYKEQGRIQMFEFLDLLSLCEMMDDQVVTDESNSPVEKTWTKLYKVDNFKHFTVPKDKKVWRLLNQRYKYEELNYNRPELKSSHFVQTPLSAEDFRTQVKLSNKQYETLQRNLRTSNRQVKLAKGGFTLVRPQVHIGSKTTGGKLNKRVASASTAGRVSWSTFTPRAGSAKTFATDDFTQRTHGARVKKPRPMSSPPVVSDRVKKDSTAKMENVQFDICTEKLRWSEHFHSNITSHLPNYHDIMKRMCKPPSAPGKKRYYRRERPSTTIITRLADPTPKPPANHIERCDALTHGIGTDDHSMMLKSKAKKVRCKSAPAPRTRPVTHQRTAKYSILLESLMQQYGYVSEEESSEEEPIEDGRIIEERAAEAEKTEEEMNVEESKSDLENPTENKVILSESLESSESDQNRNFPDDSQKLRGEKTPKQQFLEEFSEWKNEKRAKIKNMIEETQYYRVCMRPDGPERQQISSALGEANGGSMYANSVTHQLSTYKRYIRPQSGRTNQTQTDDLSEFEKHILNPENLRIRHDVCLAEDEEDYEESRRRRQAFRRIAKRYAGSDKERLKSLLSSVTTPRSPIHSAS